MSDEKVFVNDPIGQMTKEVKSSSLFEGVAIMKDDEDGHTLIYHEACDTDLWHFATEDVDFSDVLEIVLEHLGTCEPEDHEDSRDPWEDLLDDEEIEPL